MELSVFVEPSGTGFRAATGSPLSLSAEGPTADSAVEAVRAQYAERVRSGGQIRTLTITDVGAILDAAERLGANPLFEDWVESIEEYRRERDAEELQKAGYGG